VTLAGSVSGALEASPSLHFTDSDVGLASTFYLAGAVVGALVFGWMTDRLGRKMLFSSRSASIWSPPPRRLFLDLASFCLFRMLTGAGSAANIARSIRRSRK